MKKGAVFVFLQLGLLAALVLGSQRPPGPASFALAGLAILLALTAMLAMTKRTLTVMPEVARGAELSTSGPYKYIRHPMYTALMLLGAAMLIQDFTLTRAMLWLALVLVLLRKANYEERLLRSHYQAYVAYQKKTKRFIPKVY